MQTTTYKLNISPGGIPLTIHISQYDVGLREFTFEPFTNVGSFSYVEGATVTLEATKPDGYAVIHACEYNNDGSITYTLQDQLAAVPGRVWSKVVIRDGEDVLGTGAILWVVDYAGVKDGAIISDSDLSGLAEIEQHLKALVGTPIAVTTAAGMTDHSKIYLYEGSETGYTNGNWYYWNGSAWTSGGPYGGSTVEVDTTLSVAGMAADAKAAGDKITELKGEFDNTNDSLLNLNSIPVNVEFIDIASSIITQASDRNIQLTVTGINKFKLNGTASSSLNIPFDWEITSIGGATTLYYLIKRNDGINRQTGVWVQLGWFDADKQAHQPLDTIAVFNDIVPYTYSSDAVTTRNYLHLESGVTFSNTEFEIIIMRKQPLDANILVKVDNMLLADTYNETPLTWSLASGYWANNKTFATYGNIYTATVDVSYGETYLLDARSYYGMCIGVYYSGNTITSESIIDIIHLSNNDSWNYGYQTHVPKDAEHLLLQQYNTNRATLRKIEQNAVVKSHLSGKTIAYNGDSIAESRFSGTSANGGGYPYLIAEATGGFYVNNAVSGGILASAVPSGDMPHSVVNTFGQMPDADLYCFEGGINDFWRDVPLGDYSTTDYDEAVDTTTVCGALEHIFRACTYYHVGKPCVFVFVHKAVGTISANNAGYTFDQMREKMIGICHKYAIPFYDAYTESGLNGYNDIQNTTFLTANTSGTGDGIHPNRAGYVRYYVPQLINLFESLIPVNSES